MLRLSTSLFFRIIFLTFLPAKCLKINFPSHFRFADAMHYGSSLTPLRTVWKIYYVVVSNLKSSSVCLCICLSVMDQFGTSEVLG
jgi:hypothetical protein